MFSNSLVTANTNFSMPLNIDPGGPQKDLFNTSSSGYFYPPPSPPGGPGNIASPLFNTPLFDFVLPFSCSLKDLKNSLRQLVSSFSLDFFKTFKEPSSVSNMKGRDLTNSNSKSYGLPVNPLKYYAFMFSVKDLETAAETGDLTLLQDLVERGASLDTRIIYKTKEGSEIQGPNKLALIAAQHGRLNILRFLNDKGLLISRRGDATLLTYETQALVTAASSKGQIDVLELFNELNILRLNGDAAATAAAEENQVAVLRLLQRVEAINLALLSPHAIGQLAGKALEKGSLEVLIFMKEQGIDLKELRIPIRYGSVANAFTVAIRSKSDNIIHFLKDFFPINEPDKHTGNFPIVEAMGGGGKASSTLKLLLQLGVDLQKPVNSAGYLPYQYAAKICASADISTYLKSKMNLPRSAAPKKKGNDDCVLQ